MFWKVEGKMFVYEVKVDVSKLKKAIGKYAIHPGSVEAILKRILDAHLNQQFKLHDLPVSIIESKIYHQTPQENPVSNNTGGGTV
jgi:hypothetical protein